MFQIGRIPKRWDIYTNFGDIIENLFLPFKTPLSQDLFEESTYNEPFDPSLVLERAPKRVINLSGKTKRYDEQIFKSAGIEYLALEIDGGGKIPPENKVQEFINFVGRPENGELCGVHCAHGVNRTGYFVCRYLIDVLGMSAGDAIALFQEKRGHKIEKDELINALHAR
ncbi:unnamed protein product [Oikopleura dioica]|uniref:Uncharacterized protein n=1 Tax=Oikopleura dioica TaxID=34765 RepID=E4WQN1_OIKDI|nr:unnamed protein product [Oikopleura dioica]